LFSGAIESVPETPDAVDSAAAGTSITLAQRLAVLEDKVAAMQREIDALKDSASEQVPADLDE
jgi:uncharacterized protein YceH (UPF0502 family)